MKSSCPEYGSSLVIRIVALTAPEVTGVYVTAITPEPPAGIDVGGGVIEKSLADPTNATKLIPNGAVPSTLSTVKFWVTGPLPNTFAPKSSTLDGSAIEGMIATPFEPWAAPAESANRQGEVGRNFR